VRLRTASNLALLQPAPPQSRGQRAADFGQFDALEAFLVKHRIPFDRDSEECYENNVEAVFSRSRGQGFFDLFRPCPRGPRPA